MARPTILVVDDSSTVRVQLRRILTKAGYEVAVASSGIEGIDKARALRPRLVVLDIQMPDLDGYAVCQELKGTGDSWDKLPIVFLTSLQSHALSLLGNEMGAYLRKPVCPEELLGTVARCIGPGCPAAPLLLTVKNPAGASPLAAGAPP